VQPSKGYCYKRGISPVPELLTPQVLQMALFGFVVIPFFVFFRQKNAVSLHFPLTSFDSRGTICFSELDHALVAEFTSKVSAK